jgi:hypothetical protein
MEQYLAKLKEAVSASSYAQYSRIYKLLGINSPDDIKNVEAIQAKIADKSENTKKNYYAALVSLLSRMPDSYEPIIKKYRELMEEKIKATAPTDTYNEKQRASLMSLKEIEAIRGNLIDSPTEDYTKRANWDKLLDYLILSLYTLQPPRRNEYYNMKVIKNTSGLNNSDNFLLWTPKKKEFIFQDYKTAGTYGTERIPVNAELEQVLRLYLKHWQNIVRDGNNNLLVKFGNLNLENSNDITRRLNRILGKKVGASMLRHIYLSEKFGGALKEMKETAAAMGHSISQQKEYIKK